MRNKSTLTLIIFVIGFTVVFAITEFLFKTGPDPAILANPSVALFLISLFITLIAIWGIGKATSRLGLSKEEEELLLENTADEKTNSWKELLQKLTKTKPITEEATILLEHDYDGIKELDNALPPWWLYSWYASIIFAVFYFSYYHVFGGDNQQVEYEKQVEIARLQVEKYNRENPSQFDENAVTADGDTEAGKKLYKTNCAVCHAMDGGGGIGPNLTDEFWVLGGGIKNVFNTISEGGRDGKGMIAWKNSLSAEKRQQLASYILSLQGTTPKKPKDKEGDLWKGE
tara:strand:- start:424810 stop:425667 length:858 start_codon:yes stop_codon:yes gene_type:complete